MKFSLKLFLKVWSIIHSRWKADFAIYVSQLSSREFRENNQRVGISYSNSHRISAHVDGGSLKYNLFIFF